MQREISIDITKGIAIACVVIMHMIGGFRNAALIPNDIGLRFAFNLIYAFHVQLFFIIAGFLAFPKAQSRTYQARRFVDLYYPYIIWSVLTWIISYCLRNYVNDGYGLRDLLFIPILPIQHFWFLLSLLAATALLYIFRSAIALISAAVVSMIYACFGPDWTGLAYFFPFAALGALMRLNSGLPMITPLRIIVAFIALLIGAYLAATATLPTRFYDVEIRTPLLIWASVAGCYLILGIGKALANMAVGQWLATLGNYSIAIYLAHILVGSGSRIVIYRLVPHLNSWVGIGLCTAVAIAAPLIAAQIARRWGISELIGFSQFTRKAAAQ